MTKKILFACLLLIAGWVLLYLTVRSTDKLSGSVKEVSQTDASVYLKAVQTRLNNELAQAEKQAGIVAEKVQAVPHPRRLFTDADMLDPVYPVLIFRQGRLAFWSRMRSFPITPYWPAHIAIKPFL